MKTTTQLTLKHLRKLGYTCEVVERWNGFAKRRQDLFGFADIIAFSNKTTLLVQTTTSSNVSARRKKIKASDIVRRWLLDPNRIVILYGWRKKKNRWVSQLEFAQMSRTPPDSTDTRKPGH